MSDEPTPYFDLFIARQGRLPDAVERFGIPRGRLSQLRRGGIAPKGQDIVRLSEAGGVSRRHVFDEIERLILLRLETVRREVVR